MKAIPINPVRHRTHAHTPPKVARDFEKGDPREARYVLYCAVHVFIYFMIYVNVG